MTRFPWLPWLVESRVLVAVAVGLGVLGIVSLLLLPRLLASIPADYFVRTAPPPQPCSLRWFTRLAKNALGVVVLILGVAMLVLPGQGLLTILAGLLLLDFPHKRRLQRWLIGRPRILEAINAFRLRRGSEPLELS